MPDSISRRDFADWLEDRRKRGIAGKPVTQGALADAVGVQKPYISQLEHGQRRPSYGLIVSIANYFGEDATPLLRMAGYEPQSPETTPDVMQEAARNPTLLRFLMTLVKLSPTELRKLIKIAEVLGHDESDADSKTSLTASESEGAKRNKK